MPFDSLALAKTCYGLILHLFRDIIQVKLTVDILRARAKLNSHS